MNFKILYLLILFCISTKTAYCTDTLSMDFFLKNPNEETYSALIEKYNLEKNKISNHKFFLKENETEALRGLIVDHNLLAANLGFMILNSLDGGELEDMYRSISTLIDYDPKKYLLILKGYEANYNITNQMPVFLPLYTVDHINMQIRMTEERIRKLKSVEDDDLSYWKNISLAALKEAYDELKEIESENKK